MTQLCRRGIDFLALMQKKSGFTLIEVLLAVGLTTVIAVGVLAPLLFTVRSLETAQRGWGREVKELEAVEMIFRDVRSFVGNAPFPVLRIVHGGGLTVREDDRLMVWSASPVRDKRPTALIVYRVLPETEAGKSGPGLYRWELAGWKAVPGGGGNGPLFMDTDGLSANNAKIVLKGAEGIRFSVRTEKSWADEYAGEMPKALRIEITYRGRTKTYEDSLPSILKK